MTDLTNRVLKVARRDPEFRRALRAELLLQAAPNMSDERFWEITRAIQRVFDIRGVLFDTVENERELTAYIAKFKTLAEDLQKASLKNQQSLTVKDLEDLDFNSSVKPFLIVPYLYDIVRRGEDVYNKCLKDIRELAKSFAAAPPAPADTFKNLSGNIIQAYANYIVSKASLSAKANQIVGVFSKSWEVLMGSLKEKIRTIETNGGEIEKFLDAWSSQNMKGVRSGGITLPSNLAEMEIALEDLSKLVGSIRTMKKTLDRETLGMLRNYVVKTAASLDPK